MDLQEAVAILESSLNIDCSYPAAIKEIEARMMVAEVAKAELERKKGCDMCKDIYPGVCRLDMLHVIYYTTAGEMYDLSDAPPPYCSFCGRKLVDNDGDV